MREESPQTFLFADLAGFTALTEVHGDERAADLVEDFCRQARRLLPLYDSEEIKAIGDALMLRSPDAAMGVALALQLAREIGGRHGFPGVRVGVHTGPAVERDDDWFGATVNLASRVSGAAVAGEVLVTRATREAATANAPEVEFLPLGARRFKNVRDAVEVYSAVASSDARGRSGRLLIDPVCRMSVDPVLSKERRTHRAVEYHFCSPACAAAFDSDPDLYHRRGSSQADLQVSHGARERVAAFLRRAYRRGRLDVDELDERLAHVYVARTPGELEAVVTDLPGYWRLRRGGRQWFLPRRRRRRPGS